MVEDTVWWANEYRARRRKQGVVVYPINSAESCKPAAQPNPGKVGTMLAVKTTGQIVLDQSLCQDDNVTDCPPRRTQPKTPLREKPFSRFPTAGSAGTDVLETVF